MFLQVRIFIIYQFSSTRRQYFFSFILSTTFELTIDCFIEGSYTMECSDTLTNAKERFFCFFPAYDDCSTDPKLSCCFPLFPVPGSDPTNPFWPWNPGQMKLRELGEANWYNNNNNNNNNTQSKMRKRTD
jgi:hypothetical protein